MSIIQTQSEAEMVNVAEAVLQCVSARDQVGATVVTLAGDLGAGKTTVTKHIAALLGVSETVTSPTYVVMKQYELPEVVEEIQTLIHIDAYRIESIDEMRVLGFAEILKQKGTIIIIEWPEQIASLIPETAIAVKIAIDGEVGRTVTIT